MEAFNPWASSLIAYRYSEKKTKYLVASRRYRIILEYIVLYLPTCGTMPLTILSKIPNLFKVILVILLVYHISHDKHHKWSTQPLLTSIKKTHKKGLIVYYPYFTRLQSLTIIRCHYKGCIMSSVILHWSGLEPFTSCIAVPHSTTWANQATVKFRDLAQD